jgi:hypothetical protein
LPLIVVVPPEQGTLHMRPAGQGLGNEASLFEGAQRPDVSQLCPATHPIPPAVQLAAHIFLLVSQYSPMPHIASEVQPVPHFWFPTCEHGSGCPELSWLHAA